MDPNSELPYHLGLCRSCARLRILYETTLDGAVLRRVYYCRATMRQTDGSNDCNNFEQK